MFADEDLHRHAAENIDQADALLFGRVTYEMMEAAFRSPARTGARPDWMDPLARTIGAAKKYAVSSTLDLVDWNAELVRGDLGKAVQRPKRESGKGLLVGACKGSRLYKTQMPIKKTGFSLRTYIYCVIYPNAALSYSWLAQPGWTSQEHGIMF
jgi:dihydrofolate reductase